MDVYEQAFRLLPDTVIITDVYWYILDFNHAIPFDTIKKGWNLTRVMPDCKALPNDRLRHGGKVYQRSITPVYAQSLHVGYTVYLADITDRENLIEQQRRKSEELEALTQRLAKANAELEEYVRQAEALSDYEEQRRIARSIHDDVGHTVTALNTISGMCLQIGQSDEKRYEELIEEGIVLCENAMKAPEKRRFASLREMLETFRDESPFPIELVIDGDEPAIAAMLYEVIDRVCREAYHNTLSHSMADKLTVEVYMTPEALRLHITDNGCFRGTLEKGFGLTTMEENVRASGGTLAFEAEKGMGFGIAAEWRLAQ